MRLNNFIKNSDYNAEKNLINIYTTRFDIPSGSRSITQSINLPEGDYLTKYLVRIKAQSLELDIMSNSSSLRYQRPAAEVASVWVAHVNGHELEVTVNSTDMPAFTVEVKAQLSVSPF